MEPHLTRLEQLKRALEAGLIDQDTYAATVVAMAAQLSGSGAISRGSAATAIGVGGMNLTGINDGDINISQQFRVAEGLQIIYAEQGATIVSGEAQVAMPAVDRRSALGRYLQHLISQNRYLRLQGIHSGGKLVDIELDRIYVTLGATRLHSQRTEVAWLVGETALAPGERNRGIRCMPPSDTAPITVNEALADHKRMVMLGYPGSGKTTLLRYMALLYARDLAEGTHLVHDKLGLAESGALPVFLPLRQLGRYLAEHHPQEDGSEGHNVLLLVEMLSNAGSEVPAAFFDDWLRQGRAAILLDGLDEVADPHLRRRVSRLVDAFSRAYPACRYVVTSRIVGYTDASQLSEDYATTTIRDFTLADVKVFLSQWHRLIAIGHMGPGETAETYAANQTRHLLDAIDRNDRLRELAINPHMLIVIALVHRDRVKLPDRRAELYQEAVEVLLGKWDEARGIPESIIPTDRPFDISDRRLVLQHLALTLHEKKIKEIDAESLRQVLAEQLGYVVQNARELDAAVTRFLHVICERTGLLIAGAEDTYAFSHLTFQEYLAALQIAGRDDYIDYTLRRTGAEWWREVILLEAGHLSTQSKERTTRLIQAIADFKTEPEPYHNLVLAAECVRDAGAIRILGDLEAELRALLQRELEEPDPSGRFAVVKTLLTHGTSHTTAINWRIAAAEALGKIGGSQFWILPHGEPEWVPIPAGEFTMGDAPEAHRVYLPAYAISRVPITNAQYQLFVQATGHEPPGYWNGKRVSRGKEIHPVMMVSWYDALAYCRWLSQVTAKPITLPSEAEWEKVARGTEDALQYPWGNDFDADCCNVEESGFVGTTPVGIFLSGASPYGCLDMSGNVWEWTRSQFLPYPYLPEDGREDQEARNSVGRVLRGGSWRIHHVYVRCAYRIGNLPGYRFEGIGFRVVVRSSPVG